MPSRREFVTQAAVATVATVAPIAWAGGAAAKFRPKGHHIKSVVRRDETIVRQAAHADIFPMTWLADDRQFGSFSDGPGWAPAEKGDYNTQAIWINGDPYDASFQEVASYPAHRWSADIAGFPRYYGFSALAVEDRLYHLLCCTASATRQIWNGTKLIYSPDRGRTWHNQDGSTPVVWEQHDQRSRKTMLFFEEPQRAFSLVSLLQMGKAYNDNRDGYVYGYSTNGNTDGAMNQLVMFRVLKERILDRNAYEFFGGIASGGGARWVKDIHGRVPVYTFPNGWVSAPEKGGIVQAWLPSVVYIAPLDLYLMANSGVGHASDGSWSKPSYLGLWIAPKPWGPWRQIYEDAAWTPGSKAALCYSPQISPKWVAPDGKSFWLVWSDFQGMLEKSEEVRRRDSDLKKMTPSDKASTLFQTARQYAPYYSFNAQRFDLIIA